MTQPVLEPDGLRVFSLASKALSFIEDAAFEQLVDIPGKRFVTVGQSVHDCDQISVTVLTVTSGIPAAGMPTLPTAGACGPMWTVALELAIVRCASAVSAKGTVSADKLTEIARMSSQDVGVLMGAINKIKAESFTEISASISTNPSEGQLVPTTARLTVGLP